MMTCQTFLRQNGLLVYLFTHTYSNLRCVNVFRYNIIDPSKSNQMHILLSYSFILYIIYLSIPMSERLIFIMEHFNHASESSKHYIAKLIQQSFNELGEEVSLELMNQWRILSKVLNTSNKLSCLQDENCRKIIIEFINQEAVEKYRTSYFNHAKICEEYVTELKRIGAYEFIEAIKIVNKLKLIEKHYRQKMEQNTFSESHIDQKIRMLMSSCLSKKRSENNNYAKFKAIVEFEDRVELIKQLGKLLRQSWANQKKNKKNASNNIQIDAGVTFGDDLSQTQIILPNEYLQVEQFFNSQ